MLIQSGFSEQSNKQLKCDDLATEVRQPKTVPIEEFEALKRLVLKVESDGRVKIEQKDLFIAGLKAELARMKDEFALDMEEVKLQHELKTQDLEEQVKRQRAKLDLFEKNAEFDEVLATYNLQMQVLESDNQLLLAEIRKVYKTDTSIAAALQKVEAEGESPSTVG